MLSARDEAPLRFRKPFNSAWWTAALQPRNKNGTMAPIARSALGPGQDRAKITEQPTLASYSAIISV